MAESGNTFRDHFIRQRRNLVLISLFVIFYKAGSLELKTLNFLGNETSIRNPSIVSFALGAFFLYFLWRYYTACREVGGIRNFFMACHTWAEAKCTERVKKTQFKGKKVYSNQVELIGRNSALTYRVFENRDDPQSQGTEVKVTYYYALMKILSVFPTILQTSTFSEYFVPYLLALLAIAEFFNARILEQAMSLVGMLSVTATQSIIDPIAATQQVLTPISSVNTESISQSSCVWEFLEVCFHAASASSGASVFGFSEFVTASALLVLIYTFTDIRYKFRLSVTPIPLFTLTYASIAFIGVSTLIIDVWAASLWPVPDIPMNRYVAQGILGFLFLALILAWIFFAFINPPVFNRRNAKRYGHELLRLIMKGAESELPIIAHEIGRSAKNIVKISKKSPSRTRKNSGSEENSKATAKDVAGDFAYEILLMIGSRKLCRHIISASPATAMEFFSHFSDNLDRSLPIGQFVRNISSEAILNKDSILYHEDEGFNSGWLGYVRPFSKAIYGDYDLIDILSHDHSSPLDLHYKTAWQLDSDQFEVYTRVILITLEEYIKNHKRGCTQSFALNRAFEIIKSSANQVYKLDGRTDYYPSEELSKLRIAVKFVSDAVRILNKHAPPSDRLKAFNDFQRKDIFDQIAELIFELILSASGVKSPRDTCWTVHYNTVWSDLFTFPDKGTVQKIIYHRVRRLLYDEICSLSDLPNFKSARILGVCLNVLGPVIHKNTFKEHHIALHKALISWLKKNYLTLRERQPDVADACLIGSITYDADKKRLIKSYIKGLNLEEPKEWLDLDSPKTTGE